MHGAVLFETQYLLCIYRFRKRESPRFQSWDESDDIDLKPRLFKG